MREGACTRCGACCRGDPFDDTREWCGALIWEDGDPVCLARLGRAPDPRYAALWEQGCRVWPSEPEHIADKPLCGYRFEVEG